MTDIKDLIEKINALPDDNPESKKPAFYEVAKLPVADLKALVQRLEQAEKVIEQVGRECADIREGIRQGKVDAVLADNSFYVIEELIAAPI
jgi:recombinational DNA repair protein RecR